MHPKNSPFPSNMKSMAESTLIALNYPVVIYGEKIKKTLYSISGKRLKAI